MPLLTNFYLGAALDDLCQIIVTDNNTYPYSGYDLDDLGIALFYDVAAFAGPTISGADLSSPNQGGVNAVWTIPTSPGYVYNIRAFLAPVWDSTALYAAGSIVYYNGNFYYSAAGAAVGDNPLSAATWVVIPSSTPAEIAAAYALFVVADGAGTLVGYADANALASCDILTMTKTSCNNYHIKYNGSSNVSGLQVYPYGDPTDLIYDEDFSPFTTDTEWDITVPGDGVYVVKIREGYFPPPKPLTTTYYYAVIYEYCSLWNCYQAIFQALTCGQYNPCCSTCDPETLKKMDNYRQALNIMTGYMFNIFMYINIDRAYFNGVFDINTDREAYVARVNDYITKANSLMVECGWCTQISSESDSPCANCE